MREEASSQPLTMGQFWQDIEEIHCKVNALLNRYVEAFGDDDRHNSIPFLLGSVGIDLEQIESKRA